MTRPILILALLTTALVAGAAVFQFGGLSGKGGEGQNYKAGAPTLEYQTGLTLWHKADAIAGKSDGDALSQWDDSSGNDYHATQGTADFQPTYKTGILNGLPVVRFGATYTNSLNLSNVLSGFTAGEVFVVIEIDTDPPSIGDNTGIWDIDTTGSAIHFPWTDGTIHDGWGRNTRYATVNPTPSLASWRLYNVSSASGAWTNRLDTADLYGSGSASVAFPTDPALGASDSLQYHLHGDVAEFLLYDHVLTPANRATVETYLDDKYNLSY